MIRQRFTLPGYGDWLVWAYYSVGHYYTDEIMAHLVEAGCRGENLEDAYRNLSSGHLNTGLTYSNLDTHETVMVIARTSSAEEFVNSLDHERKHLEAHIAQALGLNPYGEKICYLSGEIGQKTFRVTAPLMCDCCRQKQISNERRYYSPAVAP